LYYKQVSGLQRAHAAAIKVAEQAHAKQNLYPDPVRIVTGKHSIVRVQLFLKPGPDPLELRHALVFSIAHANRRPFGRNMR